MTPNILFTTRHDGDARRKKFDTTIFAEQIHGNSIATVTASDADSIVPGVDGLVYRVNGGAPLHLAVRVADCVPILAWDTEVHVIGTAHAGWSGTLGNIVGNLISAMQKQGADPKKIRVSIGPHIGMCCYDVPEDRAKKFLTKFGADAKIASFFENAWHVDIGWANYVSCIRAGIVPKHIEAPIVCTSCQVDKYFSYRKDSNETFGEQIGAIWIGKK